MGRKNNPFAVICEKKRNLAQKIVGISRKTAIMLILLFGTPIAIPFADNSKGG